MMKRSAIVFLLSAFSIAGATQQLNSTSFYELYSVLHNPATAGSKEHAVIGSSYKRQWSGMPGSPQTSLLYGQAYLPKAKIGLGGYLYDDRTGPTSRTGLQLAYAYHIRVKEKSFFSLGIESRLQQLRFDKEKLQAELTLIDPVAVNLGNRMKADAGFGIAYTSPTIKVGAAVSQLIQTKYKLYEQVGTFAEQSRLYRHYYLHASYVSETDESTKIIPNLLLIYLPNAPMEVQSGVRIDNNLVWFGLSWRARQSWMVAAGVKVKEKLSLGFSFDLYSTPLSIFEKGSTGHELLLQYEFR
jgi:type IX secretion system PorP/SprF family membrane protein